MNREVFVSVGLALALLLVAVAAAGALSAGGWTFAIAGLILAGAVGLVAVVADSWKL